MIKKKKINKPGRIYNPENISYIDVFDIKKDETWKYYYTLDGYHNKSDTGKHSNNTYKEDFFTKQKKYLVKNKSIYIRPHVCIYIVGITSKYHYFDTIEECYKFVNSLKI